MLWTHTSLLVSQFEGSTVVDLPDSRVLSISTLPPRSFSMRWKMAKSLCCCFSAERYFCMKVRSGGLQVEQIPWDKEAVYRLPVSAWKQMMELHYPNSAWLCLRKDVFSTGCTNTKSSRGIPTWEQTLESLLP